MIRLINRTVVAILAATSFLSCSWDTDMDLDYFGYLPEYSKFDLIAYKAYVDGTEVSRRINCYTTNASSFANMADVSPMESFLARMSYTGNGIYTAYMYGVGSNKDNEYAATFDGTSITLDNGQKIEFRKESISTADIYILEYRYDEIPYYYHNGKWVEDDNNHILRLYAYYGVQDKIGYREDEIKEKFFKDGVFIEEDAPELSPEILGTWKIESIEYSYGGKSIPYNPETDAIYCMVGNRYTDSHNELVYSPFHTLASCYVYEFKRDWYWYRDGHKENLWDYDEDNGLLFFRNSCFTISDGTFSYEETYRDKILGHQVIENYEDGQNAGQQWSSFGGSIFDAPREMKITYRYKKQ